MSLISESSRRYAALLWQLVVREIEGRYRGSLLGMMWAVLSPLVMLLVYTFVFSVVFQSRWGSHGNSLDFALMVYCGMIVYGLFSELANSAPRIIVNQVNYVKKVVFPLELLPLSCLGGAIFNALIGIFLLLVFVGFTQGLGLTAGLIPFVILPFILFLCGVAWALSALGVYLRDLGQVVVPVVGVLQFMSPVFYSVDAVPPTFAWFMKLSPLTWPVSALRECVLLQRVPDLSGFAGYLFFALTVAVSGWLVFMKTRKGFADVI